MIGSLSVCQFEFPLFLVQVDLENVVIYVPTPVLTEEEEYKVSIGKCTMYEYTIHSSVVYW